MKKFQTEIKVRLHDTDMAGIIYFANQFRFAHQAWEELLAHMGYDFRTLFTKESFLCVIVHAEADYYHPLQAGDLLQIQLSVSKVGTTSFTLEYQLFKEKVLVGKVETIHVTLDQMTRKKIPIPQKFQEALSEYA